MVEKSERSKTFKASTKTYFFDIKETKEGKSYLLITESRFKGKDKKPERQTIVIFPEDAQEFAQAVIEMIKKLN